MFPSDLIRHAKDFARQWRGHKWERTDDGGILFTQAKATISGYFAQPDGSIDRNTWVNEGMDYVLGVALLGNAREAGIYLAPFANSITPNRLVTAATFPALAGEFVSNTEGYSQSTRQAWTPAAPSAGETSNAASRAELTIATASAITVRGAALVTASAKGATTGKLLALARFANERIAYNADPFPLEYHLSLAP